MAITKVGFSPQGTDQHATEVLFSKSQAADTSESGPYLLRVPSRVLGAAVVVGSTSSDDSVLDVKLDGVVVGSFTLLAGAHFASAVFDTNSGYLGSRVTVAWSSVGTGIALVTVHVDVL